MKLTSYLAKHGESDEEFAERAGISRATIKRIKKHGARSANVISKIVDASAGAVTANDLLGLTRKRSAA